MAKEVDEERILALVDEALNRTPTGGFPEIEKREGLRAGTLFDWVEKYAGAARPPAPFSALHVWIGTTTLDEGAFGRYFDNADEYWTLDEHDIEAATDDVTGCGFCIDLGSRYLYDEDLLQVIWFPQPRPVRDIIDETTMTSTESIERIVAECAARGILTANAAFVYGDPSEPVDDPAKTYNGLAYLGLYPARDA